jgi:hypothetical protein
LEPLFFIISPIKTLDLVIDFALYA